MDNDDNIVNLKETPDYIEQYVQLRNAYCDLLVTTPVNVPDTLSWLKKTDVEIRGIVRNEELLGVVVLYLERNGEIAFFVKHHRVGIGSKLLNIIENVAGERGMSCIHAWVLAENEAAKKTFMKNGYQYYGESVKLYMNVEKKGYCYRKTCSKHSCKIIK